MIEDEHQAALFSPVATLGISTDHHLVKRPLAGTLKKKVRRRQLTTPAVSPCTVSGPDGNYKSKRSPFSRLVESLASAKYKVVETGSLKVIGNVTVPAAPWN